jgi:hypothetical protein
VTVPKARPTRLADFWHVLEKLASAAEALHGEQAPGAFWKVLMEFSRPSDRNGRTGRERAGGT